MGIMFLAQGHNTGPRVRIQIQEAEDNITPEAFNTSWETLRTSEIDKNNVLLSLFLSFNCESNNMLAHFNL